MVHELFSLFKKAVGEVRMSTPAEEDMTSRRVRARAEALLARSRCNVALTPETAKSVFGTEEWKWLSRATSGYAAEVHFHDDTVYVLFSPHGRTSPKEDVLREMKSIKDVDVLPIVGHGFWVFTRKP